MIEGWYNDDYLVLFEEQEEAVRMTGIYGVRENLPGYTVVGLRGWDDFIVMDGKQQFFTIDLQAGGGSPEDAKAFVASEIEKWGPLIRKVNIRM